VAWSSSSDKRASLALVPPDRQSRLGSPLAVAVVVVCMCAAGCGRFAVRPNEKEHLADRTMQFDPDTQEAAADEHISSNREGSSGGSGSGGGGCGCN
jgi:hypothetical protein